MGTRSASGSYRVYKNGSSLASHTRASAAPSNATLHICARNGFAGTTTKSVAAAASISEGLLFKHFSSKSALYAEILAEECEADPALHALLDRPPSTDTLVEIEARDQEASVRSVALIRRFQRLRTGPLTPALGSRREIPELMLSRQASLSSGASISRLSSR